MTLSPVEPFMGIIFIFPSEVGEQIIGFYVFTLGFGSSGGGMNGGKNIRAQYRPIIGFSSRHFARPLKKKGHPDTTLIHLSLFAP